MTRKCPSCGEFTGTAHQCPVVQRRADVNDLDPQPLNVLERYSKNSGWVAERAEQQQNHLIDWAGDYYAYDSHPSYSQNKIADDIREWVYNRDGVELSEPEADELALQVMGRAHGRVVGHHTDPTSEGWRIVAFDHELHLLNEFECVCCGRRPGTDVWDGGVDTNGLCGKCRSWKWDDTKKLPMNLSATDCRGDRYGVPSSVWMTVDEVWNPVDEERDDYTITCLRALAHTGRRGSPFTVSDVVRTMREAEQLHKQDENDGRPVRQEALTDEQRDRLVRSVIDRTDGLAVDDDMIVRRGNMWSAS